jgi:hypothetical protein
MENTTATRQTAIHIKAKVLPGNRVEVILPADTIAEMVDVFVVVPLPQQQAPVPEQRSILEIVDQLEGQRIFKSAEEIDQYIQSERDSWDF